MISAISYSDLPETVVPGRTKITQINPNGNFNGAISAGQTVTFQLGGMDGFLDPYDTYVKISISFANNTNLANDSSYINKIVQLDGSASSLFSQLLLLHGNDELERIQEYDSISNVLNDMDFSHDGRGNREYEGVGGYTSSNLPTPMTTACAVPFSNSGANTPVKMWGPNQYMSYFLDFNSRSTPFGSNLNSFVNAAATPTANGGINYCSNHPIINHRYAFQLIGIGGDVGCTFSNGTVNAEFCNDFTAANGGTTNSASTGPLRYFDPQFGHTGMEPFFSQVVAQRYLYNGFLKVDNITTATYCVPLNSGFIGRVMPPENYKMLPLWLMPALRLELQFAQHAFFTSWYSTNQGARLYQVTDVKLMTTLLEPTPAVKEFVNNQVESKGIKIPSQSFTMGPRNTVFNGGISPTTPINLAFASLRNIFFFYYPNDYLASTAARKHYRLSMAITSMQVRIGTDFYPQLPIQGNGGTNLGNVNNYEFIRFLYACFGKHCSPRDCAINAQNFAVNCRAYDYTYPNSNNNDNNQLSFLEENRVIGKAVYGIPLDKLNMNSSVLGGVNTIGNSAIELLLSYSSTKVFPRNVTQYIFCHHDVALEITPSGGAIPRVEVAK